MDSENKNNSPKKQRRNSKKSPLAFILAFLTLLIICLLVFFYFKGAENVELEQTKDSNEPTTQALLTNNIDPSNFQPESKAKPIDLNFEEKSATLSANTVPTSVSIDSDLKLDDKNGKEVLNSNLEQNHAIANNSVCSQSYDVVHKFLLNLDDQTYIKPYTGNIESEIYFIDLIQKLGDNPPVVSREMDDLFTILKNTAHFFRIIGKDNILALKGILANEKDQFEVVLSHFYEMTQNENCLSEKLHLNLSKDVLYDYAGFFLNTMGGRLYLFRRDSVSRLTVSYYSILLIEQANRQGRNVHGLDIRPAVELLIPEIENSGTQLRLKDTYLEKLYELENRLN